MARYYILSGTVAFGPKSGSTLWHFICANTVHDASSESTLFSYTTVWLGALFSVEFWKNETNILSREMVPDGQGTDNDCDKKIFELARWKMSF